MEILSSPLGKLVLSLALLGAIAPIVVRFFRGTWADLETEAAAARKARGEHARLDARLPVTFILGSFSLLLINYYGSRDFYDQSVQPFLQNYANGHPGTLDMGTRSEEHTSELQSPCNI